MSNPFSNARDRDERTSGAMAADISEVLQVSHEGHAIRVQVKGDSGPETVPMLISEHGDVNIPRVGDLVVIVYGKGEKPLCIGTVYSTDETPPSTAEGERRLGHSETLSYMLFKNNGDLNITAEENLRLNSGVGGEVLIDGQAVSTSTYTDEDAQDAVGTILSTDFTYDDATPEINMDPHLADAAAHHIKYTNEEAQDAVGTILSADFTYDDAGNAINMDPHKADANVHHTKYTDAEAVSSVEATDPLTLAGLLKVQKQGTDSGTGISTGEAQRWAGPSSDLLLDIQGGHGRVGWSWNAYYDSSTNDWRYLVGGETAMMIHMNAGTITIRTASSGTADAVVSWESYTFDGGNITADQDINAGRYARRGGFFTGYLSTSQTTVETGKEANVFENVEVDDGPYTRDSNSQVTVSQNGKYRIQWETGFKQVGGNSRAEMQSMPRINGVNRGEFRSYCYIRLANGNGDSNSCGNETVLSLTSGDTIAIWVDEYSATGYDHNLNHASVTLEYLG